MPLNAQEDFFLAADRLLRGEHLEMPLSKPLFNMAVGLHELRIQASPNIYRIFYCIREKDAIYIIHAMQKKTQQLPNRDRHLILKRLKEI